ncbi:hypothetical protein [Nocardioides sp. GXZ039]|uniref:hypothetical protein n=1 Tax=Nocardioides sp. GXZ039 TaxID=3136018 RepID=UPI0030F381B4
MRQPPALTDNAMTRLEAWLAQCQRHCKNPRCMARLTYPAPPKVGRRPDFCQGACRAAYRRDRERLLALKQKIAGRSETPGAPPEASRDRARAHVRWALQLYGVELDGDEDAERVGLAASDDDTQALPVSLPEALRCLNPKCVEWCRHRTGRQGRQPRFCSSQCGDVYRRDRERLIRHWGELAWSYEFTNIPYEPKRLEHAARRIEWLLADYGIEDVRACAQVPQPPVELQLARKEVENLGLPLFPSQRTRPLTAHEADVIQHAERLQVIWYANRTTSRRL